MKPPKFLSKVKFGNLLVLQVFAYFLSLPEMKNGGIDPNQIWMSYIQIPYMVVIIYLVWMMWFYYFQCWILTRVYKVISLIRDIGSIIFDIVIVIHEEKWKKKFKKKNSTSVIRTTDVELPNILHRLAGKLM